METIRTPRAIQRDDVWAAADALLLAGKRPTIERVRQHIGRGSPNTVSPMLEEWFATLGPRMAQLQAGAGQVLDAASDAGQGAAMPPALAEAMRTLWQGALEHAEQAAVAKLAAQREQLEQEQAQLQEAQAELQQAQTAMEQQRLSLEQALAVAHAQIKMQTARVADLEQSARQKDQLATQQQQRMQALEQELFATRKARDDSDRQHMEQMREAQAAAQAQQHRLLQEVDRARQDAKQWMAAQRHEQEKLAKLEQQWHSERQVLEQQRGESLQQLRLAQTQTQQLQQGLEQLAEQHGHQQALQAQQNHAALAQLQWELEKWRSLASPAKSAAADAAGANTGSRRPSPLRAARSAAAARNLPGKLGRPRR